MLRQLRPKQLRIAPLMASLAALSLLLALPSQARASSVGAPVPKPNGPSQVPASIALPVGGFAWTPVTLPYGTNGSQMAVGGAVDAGSRLSVNPSGAAENGISVTMPSGATGNAVRVKQGATSFAKIDALGRGVFYNPAPSAYQTYHGLEVGQNLTVLPSSAPGTNNGADIEVYKDSTPSAATSFGLNVPGAAISNDLVFSTWNGSAWSEAFRVVNAGPFQRTCPSPSVAGVVIVEASGQTADAEQLQTSTGTVLSHTTAAGKAYAQGFGVRSGTTDTPGYTGTIPTTNTGIHVSGGIVVGYSDSTGATVGN